MIVEWIVGGVLAVLGWAARVRRTALRFTDAEDQV